MSSKPILIEDLGMQYNETGLYNKVKRKSRFGLYKCGYCQSEFKARTYDVKRGVTKSCGCLKHKGYIKHGLSKNKYYSTWGGMLRRCTNVENHNYVNYGGRGIKVCEEWLDVKNFIEWAESTHPNIEGMSLDRIDTNGNYEPSNCRWSDKNIQNLTQRLNSKNTSGFKEVYKNNKGRWVAQIRVNGKLITLGRYLELEQAVLVRDTYIIDNNLKNNLSVQDTKLGKA